VVASYSNLSTFVFGCKDTYIIGIITRYVCF
jgi:hypothetical protein BACCOPRO_00190